MARNPRLFFDSFLRSFRQIFSSRNQISRKLPTEKASGRLIQIVIEEHEDGFVAYPLGITGVIVGEGDTKDEAFKDVLSAIKFHVETFGIETLEEESPILNAYIEEVRPPELAVR